MTEKTTSKRIRWTDKKVERAASLRWIPLVDMKVNDAAQRKANPARIDRIAAEMDLEQLGNPTVSARGDAYYILDGQHRVEAFKKWCGDGGWEDQSMQCWVYENLTEDEEAEVFLKLNDTLTVSVFEKFRVGVQAGRMEETDIDRIVRALGLKISRQKGDGAILAVGTLRRVYNLGPGTLHRTLRIIRDAFGDPGLEAPVIEGLGLLCSRYNGVLDEKWIVEKLSGNRGGLGGLMNAAGQIKADTGLPRAHCVAAAAVDTYNRGRGGPSKLPSWWRNTEKS